MSTHHELYMRRCFHLARQGVGAVSPNPMVGAVLVSESGKIIGEGWHKKYGEAHAEVHCFASVSAENQSLISKSTLYCSLEPCHHVGKTPPCVNEILKLKIPRVVISNLDPNPLVGGKSILKMRQSGIEVITGVLKEEGAHLNRPFFKWITQKKPYVILKWAQTADGFLSKVGERTVISAPDAQRLVHRWRAEADAILVGKNTAVTDNPRLDTRYFFGKNPLRIGIDARGELPAHAYLLDNSVPTWILGTPPPDAQNLRQDATNTRFFPELLGKNLIPDLLQQLYSHQKAILLVEGGTSTLQQFIEQEVWDEIRILQSRKRLHAGVPAPTLPPDVRLLQHFVLTDDFVEIFFRKNSAHSY